MSKNVGSIRIITKKYVKDVEKHGHMVPTRYRTIKNIYGVLPFRKLPEEYKTGSYVYFDPEILKVSPDAKFVDKRGRKRGMKEADLDEILQYPVREPDGRIRAYTSKLLIGETIGPFSYKGTRSDDPNDIIPHQDRRELRGLIAISAFASHNDMKGPNSLDMYVTEDGRSYVKHHLIDFGSTLGVGARGPDKPLKGNVYTLVDFKDILLNIFTLGLYVHPWERAEFPNIKGIGSFGVDTYSPGKWKPSNPNAAVMNATNLDGYWGAKIVMSFTDEHLRAIVKKAKFSDSRAEEYMSRMLMQRRDKTGRYWYSKVNPLDRFTFSDKRVLRFDDMAVVGRLEKGRCVVLVDPPLPELARLLLRGVVPERLLLEGRIVGRLRVPENAVPLSQAAHVKP